ncbi:MAG: peptidase [Kiritimatiellales bacterium]|nr:peptidase [Kiritimatiellota bacterium]MBL7012528.1 peptidase [Kiritimatiellales bacterium]
MNRIPPVLFVFIDGLGLGSNDPAVNPLADTQRFPTLGKLLADSVPLDASLGVPGLPQSATGQAALLTGLNAPELMGRHIEGFPPPRLKTLVQEHNIFSRLLAAGKTCTFANEYWLDDVAYSRLRTATARQAFKRESVTTVATLAAFGGVRGKAELAENRAVYHDLTREALRARGYDGPLITPEEAAEHLIGIANDHDFTLFEFFQTDHAGHSANWNGIFHPSEAREAHLPEAERQRIIDPWQTLEKLDAFFSNLWKFKGLLVVTSDHGNIEDMTVRTHTTNSVPLYASKPERFQGLENISQLTPALLDLLIG